MLRSPSWRTRRTTYFSPTGEGRRLRTADILTSPALRLSDGRGKDDIHIRAKKLKDHYKAVQACDQIMAYGFVIILFLLTGFYWFIIIFNEEIRHTFHVGSKEE